jgi:hypothetical protein
MHKKVGLNNQMNETKLLMAPTSSKLTNHPMKIVIENIVDSRGTLEGNNS